MTPPEPAIEPAAASESKSIGISSSETSRSFSLKLSPARKTFAELPPGMTALILRPGFGPPAISLITWPIVSAPTSISK